MSATFEELDRRPTPLGLISLRRRFDPTLQVDVFEAKLDDEFLMSSAFTVAEIALAEIALAGLPGADLDVVVGGLGLGYTARAVLDDPRVRSLHVVEALGEVIEWHRRGLLPLSDGLTADERCTFVEGDFFAMVAAGSSFAVGRRRTAMTPSWWTSTTHLITTCTRVTPPSTTGQGSDASLIGSSLAASSHCGPTTLPTRTTSAVVERVFASCEAHVVTFPNPLTGGGSANTVYVAQAATEG